MKKSALLVVLVCASAALGAQKPWDQEFKPDVDETGEDVTLEQLAQLENFQLENIWASMGDYQDNYVGESRTHIVGFRDAPSTLSSNRP